MKVVMKEQQHRFESLTNTNFSCSVFEKLSFFRTSGFFVERLIWQIMITLGTSYGLKESPGRNHGCWVQSCRKSPGEILTIILCKTSCGGLRYSLGSIWGSGQLEKATLLNWRENCCYQQGMLQSNLPDKSLVLEDYFFLSATDRIQSIQLYHFIS